MFYVLEKGLISHWTVNYNDNYNWFYQFLQFQSIVYYSYIDYHTALQKVIYHSKHCCVYISINWSSFSVCNPSKLSLSIVKSGLYKYI